MTRRLEHVLTRRLLHGLPGEVVESCCGNAQIRRLLRFRFLYLCTVHAAVLVPLLNLFGGLGLSLMSLGVASGVVALAQIPAGIYADRVGPKWALRWGAVILGAVTTGFFLLCLARVGVIGTVPLGETWEPGVVGMFVLEAAMGFALALISGADTLFFRDVLKRQGIALERLDAMEGAGSAVRYYGTMLAVGFGSIYYFGLAAIPMPAEIRILLQAGVFLISAVIQGAAVVVLTRIDAPHERLQSPDQLRQYRNAVKELFGVPTLVAIMWLCCLTLAAETFASNFFQHPLSQATEALLAASAWFVPLYAVVMMVGRWASAQGSRLYQHSRLADGDRRGDHLIGMFAAPAAIGLLSLAGLPMAGSPVVAGFVIAAVGLVGFSGLRGLLEPYTRILLIHQAAGRPVRNTIIATFGIAQRVAHLGLASLFYILGAYGWGEAGRQVLWGTTAVLALTMAAGILFLAVGRGRRGIEAVVIGSYREDFSGLHRFCEQLRKQGVRVSQPPPNTAVTGTDDGFVRLSTDATTDEGELQRRVFQLIERADVVFVYTPTGRVGTSTAMEIWHSVLHHTPVLVTAPLTDATLRSLLKKQPEESVKKYRPLLNAEPEGRSPP